MSGWYASYWNAFLFKYVSFGRESHLHNLQVTLTFLASYGYFYASGVFCSELMISRIISNIYPRCLLMLLGMDICSNIKFYCDSSVNNVKSWHITILDTVNDT